MSKPAGQICPVCGYDDDVNVQKVDDTWLMTCENPSHVLFEWKPTVKKTVVSAHRSGLGEELGVYDTLLACVEEGAAEYGVIEHRFSEHDRATYDVLLQRYGHRTMTPKPQYTVSQFLGGALGQLWREGAIAGRMVPATGLWSSNELVGGYGPADTDLLAGLLPWDQFAIEELDADPETWPALRSEE